MKFNYIVGVKTFRQERDTKKTGSWSLTTQPTNALSVSAFHNRRITVLWYWFKHDHGIRQVQLSQVLTVFFLLTNANFVKNISKRIWIQPPLFLLSSSLSLSLYFPTIMSTLYLHHTCWIVIWMVPKKSPKYILRWIH